MPRAPRKSCWRRDYHTGGAGRALSGCHNHNPSTSHSARVVVDKTEAWGASTGRLAVALAEGRSIADALRFGGAVAGISATRSRAGSSMPTRAKIDTWLS